ncbi:hypothetical protein [Pectinatus frisingensis]|uniref:mannitol dehydrogenase family protein n=1 Tax=Pectinatus frisingensis TaxID=865 RepID=UPI0018C85612|nr:hypothetical protein [Pectinatus frisingensis]
MKFIMYGAGNIGRGFIGPLFSQIGYEVVFIDVDKKVVDELNKRHEYYQEIIDFNNSKTNKIKNIRAINGTDKEKIAAEIANADLMATAVGAVILPKIANNIAYGLQKRWEKNNDVFNILICENLMNGDEFLKNEIKKHLNANNIELFSQKVGIVETCIGRMVPVVPTEKKIKDTLYIAAEPYEMLPIDKAHFLGKLPVTKKIIPYEPFEFYIQRKLYVHNMAHAICAYLGMRKNLQYINDAIKIPAIRLIIIGAMQEVLLMLAKKYNVDFNKLYIYMMDLLYRFQNPGLKDTLVRVGRDPLRKLQPDDRLIGAANNCLQMNIPPIYISIGIAGAIISLIGGADMECNQKNCEYVLKNICKITVENSIFKYVNQFFNMFINKDSYEKMINVADFLYKKNMGDII